MRRTTALALALLTLTGCGPRGPRQDVGVLTGTVRYQGQPLGGGTVTAVTPDGEYRTIIRTDGTYRLEGKPGPVRLAVETESMKLAGSAGAVDPRTGRPAAAGSGGAGYVAVPAKYGNAATSGLTAELRPGEQAQDLDLP